VNDSIDLVQVFPFELFRLQKRDNCGSRLGTPFERLVTGFGGRRCGCRRDESPSLSLIQRGPIEFPGRYTTQ
jgi:hypothetical protein